MLSAAKSSKNLTSGRELSNILLFSLGKLVSLFGSSIYTFTIGLYVLKITGSGLSFAASLVLGTLPAIVINPFAGVLADRVNKKLLVVLMDFLNGALFIIIYFISLTNLSLIIIYTSTFITAVLTTIFDISLEAAKPDIVSEHRLMSVNSVSKIIDSSSSILGPMAGGLVFAILDIRFFIILNGISFIFSGFLELIMDFKLNIKDIYAAKKVDFIKDIKEGFNYMRSQKNILSLFYVFILLNLFLSSSISIPLPFIINRVLKLSSNYFGIIEGMFSIGMILGAVFVRKISDAFPYSKLLVRMSFVLSLCMVMTGLVLLPNIKPMPKFVFFIYYSAIMAVLGIAISFIDIPLFFILQKVIPEELRGRVLSLGLSLAKAVCPFALILSGFLINNIPIYILPIASGVELFVSIILLSKKHSIKGWSTN